MTRKSNNKSPRKAHCIPERRCWGFGHNNFKVLAGYPSGELQWTVGKATIHDRLLILLTEMTASELF